MSIAATTRRNFALVLSLGAGLLGWWFLVFAEQLPWLSVEESPPTELLPLLIFAAVIVAVRTLAVPMFRHVVLSFDAAMYVAASLCLGALAAGRMVAVALTIDAGVRIIQARRLREPSAADLPMGLSYVVYFGGVSGGLLLFWSNLFSVDDVMRSSPSHLRVTLEFMLIASTFLLSHYAVQAWRSVLRGRPLRAYVYEVALPGLLAEVAVMPVGILVVFVYQPDALLGLVLISATYVVLHTAFYRLSHASDDLARRVHDLEILNRTAQKLSARLELTSIIDAVAHELPLAVGAADWVTLLHRGRDRDPDGLVVERFNRLDGTIDRGRIGRNEGAAGLVVARQSTVIFDDLRLVSPKEAAGPTAGEAARSFIGVPLFVEDRCEGALVVASRSVEAFGGDERRVIEGMALQVSAALQNAHLFAMAMVDGLTGLFVRRYLDARIVEELERARRYNTEFAVIMLDIDDFKKLNDTHGHLTGDRVLRELAAVVRGEMRGVDTAARYGGEEFAVVLPRTNKHAAYRQAERIRTAIASRDVAIDGESGATVRSTASFGIAAFPDGLDVSGVDGFDVMRRADRALYRAKELGKNRVELDRPEYVGDTASNPGIAIIKRAVPEDR